jgi:hypothetical protein
MTDESLPIDRPAVTFTDEDAPAALVPQPEPDGSLSAVVAAAEADSPLAEGEAALAEATAAAAGAVGVSGPGAASTVAASAAVTAQGGGAQTAGAAFQLSDDVGLAVATFNRARARPANPKLLKLFIQDDHLQALWSEIGRVELEVVALTGASAKLTRELFDRLTMARNLLLSDRDEYEDVLRQVNIVKNKVLRVRHSNRAQQPWTIQLFLYGLVGVLVWLFLVGPRVTAMLGNPPEIVGIATPVLWNSVLWGGIGGLSAALYALVKHVEDYDSPMIGLFFGPLVALLADVGLPAFVQLVGDAAGEMEVRPAVMYLLAWAVGFKQNLLIQLINSVLARIVPGIKSEEAKADAAKG